MAFEGVWKEITGEPFASELAKDYLRRGEIVAGP